MKILIVSQYFWPENFRVNDLVLELNNRGHEVVVLTGKPNYPSGCIFPEYKNNPLKFSSYEGVTVLRVPIIPQGNNGVMRILNYFSYAINATILGAYYLRNKKFDSIFVFQTSPATVGFPAVIMRWLKKAPLAIWVLDQWPETLEAVGVVKSKHLLNLLGKCIKALYKRCDLILVQSQSLVTLIRTKYVSEKRQSCVHYFPNWAESLFHNTIEAAAPEIQDAAGVFNVMFAGNIGESQDFPTILDAAEKLINYENIRWLIVGQGNMFDWVKKEIIRRDLKNKFILLGSYPVERMPSFYMHADALLVSLKPEPIFSMTLPGKVQSYFAASVPVIGMLDGEGGNIINEASAGIVCSSGDSEALADAVLNMSKIDKNDLEKLGKNGFNYGKLNFDRDSQINKFEEYLLNMTLTD